MEKDLEKVQSAAEFIQIVKKEKSIYDFTDPDYKIAEHKALAWQRVALKSDMSVELAKRRWKNLRDSYTKYLKSFKNLESQDSLTYVRKYKYWAHAEAMDFLKPFQGPPRSRKKDFCDNIRIINANDYESMPYGEEENNFDLSSQLYEKMNSNDSDIQHSSFDQQESAYNVNESQYDINNSSYTMPDYSDDIQKTPFENELKEHSVISKQNLQTIEYNTTNGIIQNSSISNKKISVKATDLDSTSLFFLSLAKSVRKMPLKHQARIKVQCLQIVNEMELNLEETNNSQNKKKIRKLAKEPQQEQQQCNTNPEHFTYEMSPSNVEAMIEITSSDDENLAENTPN